MESEEKGRKRTVLGPMASLDLNRIEELIEKKLKQQREGSFKKRMQIFVGDTTFHGLYQAFNPDDPIWSRVIWSLVVIFMLAITFMQCKSLVVYFMQNPTVTSVQIQYPKGGLKIPPLTLCTISKLNYTAVKTNKPEMGKTLAEFSTASFFSAYGTALMDLDYFIRQNYSNERLEQSLIHALGGQSLSSFFEDSAFSCLGQLLTCWFENGIMIKDCCKTTGHITVKRYLVHSGPCFEIQSHMPQRLPGPVGGLGFVYWYPNAHILPSAFNAYDEHAVHLYTSVADAMLEKNPTVLPVGMHNHIRLSATRTVKLLTDELGRPTCINPTLKYFDEYSFPKCQVECLIDAMLDNCNCTGVSMYGKIPRAKLCSPLESINCFKLLAYDFTDMLVECREQKCPEPCDYWTYSPSLTVGKTFNPMIEKEMKKYWLLPPGDPKQSLIIADIYFDENQYMEIEQKSAFNIETFVSTIGGAMGLWTGASIVTWIHLVYYCLVTCAAYKRGRQEQQRTAMQLIAAAHGAESKHLMTEMTENSHSERVE